METRTVRRYQGRAAPGARKGGLAFAAAWFGFVALCVLAGRLPSAILLLYAGASAAAFVAYAVDKAAARDGRWRTRESTLHLLAVVGGWPGALIAQQLLRHKSAKASFRAGFLATAWVNGAILVICLLHSPARIARALLGAA